MASRLLGASSENGAGEEIALPLHHQATTEQQMKTKTKIRAGHLSLNHVRVNVKTKTEVRAGHITLNHVRVNVKTKTKVRAGHVTLNHVRVSA